MMHVNGLAKDKIRLAFDVWDANKNRL